MAMGFLAPMPAAANHAGPVPEECLIDQQGPDDEPGQKDLNELCNLAFGQDPAPLARHSIAQQIVDRGARPRSFIDALDDHGAI